MVSLDNGFHEVLAIVHSAAASAPRLMDAFNYTELYRGTPDPAVLASLGIPEGWEAEEVLIGDPAQERGFIRLLSFPGQRTGLMRDGGKPWDRGGIFDVNIRALGPIEQLCDKMNENGYVAFAPTTHWQFGPLEVKETVLNDPDGVCVAVMERLSPPLEGYEHVKGRTSYVFNSTQIVPDFAAARAFYVDALGWEPVQETEWTHEDGKNCLGLPPDIASTCPVKVGIYQSHGRNEGSVEIIDLDVGGIDMSEGRPPQRGLAALRFPMADAQAFLDRAKAGGCEIVPLADARIEPYGAVRLGAAITPWGARLEAYEPG